MTTTPEEFGAMGPAPRWGSPRPWPAGRVLGGLLYGVQAADSLTLAGSTLLLALVAFGATLLPALRAARLDPAPALRSEA